MNQSTFNRSLTICQIRDEYRGFYDHERADKLLTSATQQIADEVLLDVLADWKSASNAFRTPWLDLNLTENFYKAYLSHQPTVYERMNYVLKTFYLSRLKDIAGADKIDQITGELDKVTADALRQHREERVPPVAEPMWKDFIKHPEYAMSLWSLQNMAFTSIYFAYESGLRKLLSVKTGRKDYQVKDHLSHAADLRRHLWTTADADLLTPTVSSARVIRNAITHNGARVTNPVTKAPVVLCRITGGLISVLPDNIRLLHEHLLERLELVASNCR